MVRTVSVYVKSIFRYSPIAAVVVSKHPPSEKLALNFSSIELSAVVPELAVATALSMIDWPEIGTAQSPMPIAKAFLINAFQSFGGLVEFCYIFETSVQILLTIIIYRLSLLI